MVRVSVLVLFDGITVGISKSVVLVIVTSSIVLLWNDFLFSYFVDYLLNASENVVITCFNIL